MEEDIKLLEELIEHNYLEDIFYLRENNHHTKFNKAIENLINKNKELEKQIEEYKLNAEENMHEAQENARLFRKEQAKKNEYKKIVEIMSKTMHYICLFSSQSKYVIAKYCKIYNSENIGECEGSICSECVADYFRKKAKGE